MEKSRIKGIIKELVGCMARKMSRNNEQTLDPSEGLIYLCLPHGVEVRNGAIVNPTGRG